MDCKNCAWPHIETAGVLDLTRVKLSELPEALKTSSDRALSAFTAHCAAQVEAPTDCPYWTAGDSEIRRRHRALSPERRAPEYHSN